MPDTERKKLYLLIGVGIVFSLAWVSLLNRVEAIRLHSDLYPLWAATRNLLEQGRSVYDLQNGADMQAFFAGQVHFDDGLFYYPATLLVFLAPLAALPFQTAHFIWTLATLWMFFAGTWLVMAAVDWPRSVNGRTLLLALGTLSIPVWQHTIWAQFNSIAVLALGASLWQLHRGRYGWAGLLAAGLSFKPQASLVPMAFLGLWALLERKRWRLLGGLAGGLVGLELLAELLQPGWVSGFMALVAHYANSPRYPLESVMDQIWNPYQLGAAAVMASLAALTIWKRRLEPEQPAFSGLLAYSLAAGWLAMPILGMVHLVAAPAVVALALSSLQALSRKAYRLAAWAFGLLYAGSLAGFGYGLLRQYGLQIELAQLIGKELFTICLALAALWAVIGEARRSASAG